MSLEWQPDRLATDCIVVGVPRHVTEMADSSLKDVEKLISFRWMLETRVAKFPMMSHDRSDIGAVHNLVGEANDVVRAGS